MRPTSVEPGSGDLDLSDRVVAMAGAVDRGRVRWLVRALLGVMAAIEMAIAVPLLFGFRTDGDPHLARHVGAFTAAYAFGLAAVALRPAKARAMVPITVALGVAMAGGAVADIVRGETPALGELSHLPEILGLVLVWMMATHRGASPAEPQDATVTSLDDRR